MAKDIDLSQKAKASRLAIATGAATPGQPDPLAKSPLDKTKQRILPMPKQAAPLPPGVTGTPPMPGPSKIVGFQGVTIDPERMTEAEIATLQAVGWTENVPIPRNVGKVLREAQLLKEAEVDMPRLDPRTPPIEIKPPVPIESLPPEQRAKFSKVQEMFTQATTQLADDAATQATEAAQQASAIPGLSAAAKLAARVQQEAFEIDDDRPKAAAPAPEPVAGYTVHEVNLDPPAAKPTPAAPAAVSDTGANAGPSICPHCLWHTDDSDIKEPPYADKMAFLRAMCGQKPFSKTYELYGGQAYVTFRSLMVREVNEIYRQTYVDRNSGKFQNDLDYYEQLNIYRLCLQLQKFTWPGPDGFDFDLPDGLSMDTNEFATGVWTKVPHDPMNPEAILPEVENHIREHVLKTESLMKTINLACSDFNRLLAKLEAVAQNPDFWKPTGEPS